MNTKLLLNLIKVSIFVITLNWFSIAQITSSSSSGRNSNKTQEVQQSEAVVNQVTDKVGILFKEGMLALKDQKRSEAGEKFNKSVEVFLLSSTNKESNPRLFGCYNELIETVFRIEFPNTEPPNIRSLSSTCGWNWNNSDYLLADVIVDGFNNEALEPQTTYRMVLPKDARNRDENNGCGTDKSLVIQDLVLGMSALEISKKLKRKVTLTPNNKVIWAKNSYAYFRNLTGVDLLFLRFYRAELFEISVHYDKSIKWNGIEEFQSAVTKALGLPNSWAESSPKGSDVRLERELTCNGITLLLREDYLKNFELLASDQQAVHKMVEETMDLINAKKKSEERKKREFKP